MAKVFLSKYKTCVHNWHTKKSYDRFYVMYVCLFLASFTKTYTRLSKLINTYIWLYVNNYSISAIFVQASASSTTTMLMTLKKTKKKKTHIFLQDAVNWPWLRVVVWKIIYTAIADVRPKRWRQLFKSKKNILNVLVIKKKWTLYKK